MYVFTLTVNAHERVLEYLSGRLTRVLEPGRHRRRFRAGYRRIDVRDRISLVAPQEVMTSDGVTVKVTVAIRWSVADAAAFAESTTDPSAVVYLAVQIGLREAIAGVEAAQAIGEGRRTVSDSLSVTARTAGTEVGISVREVVVKDVILPQELRSAYADLVATRQRGQAALEAARAETAALRSLANAAKLLDDHPALAQLRLVQSLPHGAKVVLNVAADQER